MKDYLRFALLVFFVLVAPLLRLHPGLRKWILGSSKSILTRLWGEEFWRSKRTMPSWPMDTGKPAAGSRRAPFQVMACGSINMSLLYGLTDRIEAAGYLNLAKPNGHGLMYAGSKFRVRGRLFDEEVLPVDLGWYLEIEYKKTPQFNDATLEFEMRIPMQKDIGPFSILFNPIFEKPVTGSEKYLGFEFGYSTGYLLSLDARAVAGA